jgi:DNA-binding CsgD family transcriptional regulator
MGGQAVRLLEREEPRAHLEAGLTAARAGRGGVISVEGEAGIGKTSLILSFAQDHRDDARVYVGGCEHLTTPEPLGPLRDIARDSQGRFSISPVGGQMGAFETLLRLLTSGRGPALLVLEDIHWADDATLDLVRYLGRRIRTAPVLLVVTFRNDEAPSAARLASLWADMPRDARERVELRPLSLTAVSTLAGPTGRTAKEVFATTGGNPFHVTEYLASVEAGVPRSVQDATLARAAGLTARARRVLDCAAIFPRQIDEATLRALSDDADSAGVEECLRAGMLGARGEALAFRHELARRAILDAISPLRRRELHQAALRILKDRADIRAAEIAHHAQGAGAVEDLVRYSILAAEEAGALGAHREAVAHLAVALAQGAGLSDAERGQLLELQAEAGQHCGAFDVAMPAIQAAIDLYRRTGDVLGLGNALRIATRLTWFAGQTDRADEVAQEALEVLRDHVDSWQYALALSSQSQVDMLADRIDLAIQRGSEAMERAQKLGRTDIYLHALTNVCAARCSHDIEGGIAQLVAAIEEARRLGGVEALPRLYSNLTFVKSHCRVYDGLLEDCAAGIEVSVARDNAPIEEYIRGARASTLLDLGRLQEAVDEAEFVLHGPYPKGASQFPALLAASRARVRLGLPEGGAIDEARSMPTSRRDIMRLAPLAVADAEAQWLGVRQRDAVSALREVYEKVLEVWGEVWTLSETAMWLRILGAPVQLPAKASSPVSMAQQLYIAGDWQGAAKAWAAKGCPYEQAIALCEGGEAEQRQALALFDRIGAAPAAARLRRTMRESGLRGVPTGPRSARRSDPAGLTPRQGQVLALLAEGLSNLEIADRLNTSAKTVEHHVGAILAALEAPSRLKAVQIARERGVVPEQI